MQRAKLFIHLDLFYGTYSSTDKRLAPAAICGETLLSLFVIIEEPRDNGVIVS